ncbi:MAG: hypothetical protein MUC78_10410, partial [Bacteroidales bacterium]|nr:hypothetical protein [Bacteroidales bacterium]
MKNRSKGSIAVMILATVLSFPVTAAPLFSDDSPASPRLNARAGQPANNEWRIYDINADGTFNKTDIEELLDRGYQEFNPDLNGDGKKDGNDAFSLYLKLSIMDRSCDQEVNDEDFKPVSPVSLPDKPEIATILNLVNAFVSEARSTLPADIEIQLFNSLPDSRVLTFDERVYVFQTFGLSALIQKNIEAAQWAFGRAFQMNNQSSSALGNLAFAVAMDNRHTESLYMLAYARSLFHECAATSTCIGWIFARHGQNQAALPYYREAVTYAPKIAQYHYNLGILLMRIGSKREAYEEFKTADELNPGNFKYSLSRHITKPPEEPPVDEPLSPEELEEEYEEDQEDLRESGATEEEMPPPWDELSPCDKARYLPEVFERKVGNIMNELAQSRVDEMTKKLNDISLSYAPKFQNCKEDWNNWVTGVPAVDKIGTEMAVNAMRELGDKQASLTREMGYKLLNMSSFFMECALASGKIEGKTSFDKTMSMLKDTPLDPQSVEEFRSEAYQEELEEAIKYCYGEPMRTASIWIKTEACPYGLPNPTIETVDIRFAFLLIMSATFEIEGYCSEDADLQKPEFPSPGTIGLNLLIASFEWNPETGEVEFTVGQGLQLG